MWADGDRSAWGRRTGQRITEEAAVVTEKKYYSTVTEVLDDMIGANYAITEAQINGIRALLENIRNEYRNSMRYILMEAYEAGKEQDDEKYDRIYNKISDGGYDSGMF